MAFLSTFSSVQYRQENYDLYAGSESIVRYANNHGNGQPNGDQTPGVEAMEVHTNAAVAEDVDDKVAIMDATSAI